MSAPETPSPAAATPTATAPPAATAPSKATAPPAATAPSTATPPTAEELRAEITKTRRELGETVAALASKTDVKARTKEAVAETTEHVKQVASRQARTIGPGAVVGAAAGAVVAWIWWRRRR